MAGHRRAKSRPTQRSRRAGDWRARTNRRLAQAITPAERISVAVDHARVGLALLPGDPDMTRDAELLVDALIAFGDRGLAKAAKTTTTGATK